MSALPPSPLAPLAPLRIVIPVRNEASRLPLLLADLAAAPSSLLREVWVVDGGSVDGSGRLARLGGARLLQGGGGRGGQLLQGIAACVADGEACCGADGVGAGDAALDRAGGAGGGVRRGAARGAVADGAAAAAGAWDGDGQTALADRQGWLLLLHGDVRLPPDWPQLVQQAIARGGVWTFPLAIEVAGPLLRLVAALSTLRARLFQLPYGDQGLLLSQALYQRSGGLAPLPLMEDLEFVLRLRRLAPIRLLPQPLRVDGRRWRRLGVLRTAWSNAALRRAWRRGVDPAELARRYDRGGAAGSCPP